MPRLLTSRPVSSGGKVYAPSCPPWCAGENYCGSVLETDAAKGNRLIEDGAASRWLADDETEAVAEVAADALSAPHSTGDNGAGGGDLSKLDMIALRHLYRNRACKKTQRSWTRDDLLREIAALQPSEANPQ